MQIITVGETVEAVNGKFITGNPNAEIKGFSLDSRNIKPGEFFIAIRGNRFNGHMFLNEVLKKKASGIIIEKGRALPEYLTRTQNKKIKQFPQVVIRVDDTISALGDIARFFRDKFCGPVIGITGTVGKTGTKEIISSVLSQKLNVHKTEGTLNNHIGVPLTMINYSSASDVAVVELGMNRLGEIRYLSGISKPDVGIITNIGPAHLEYLGDISNIIKAKSELLEFLGRDKLIILNKDDKYFNDLRRSVKSRLITVGKTMQSDYQAAGITIDKDMRLRFKIIARPFSELLEVELPVVGIHNVYAALVAAAVAYGLGLKADEIIKGLSEVSLPKMRLEIKDIAGIKVINDCYNANPVSMISALETVSGMKISGKKIFVCGDMLELGGDSIGFHEELGIEVERSGINKLVTVGNLSKHVSKKAVESGVDPKDVYHCNTNLEAVEFLAHLLESGDTVLVKGSRANRMEEIVNGLEECYKVLEQLIV